MVSLPAEFRARLETYSGPLDLLLYLIKKEEVDVFDIPIARLVEQYQLYLEVLRDIDPNACGEFLVMAARLMEIKSKLLLPREVLEEDEEELDDPRLELVRQLLEYKKFKERALLLERRLDWHRQRHRRPLDLPQGEEDEPPVLLGSLSVWDLLTAFHRVEIAIGRRMPHQVVLEDRALEEYVDDVVTRLQAAGDAMTPFDELFTAARSRMEAVGYFLAILMLAKEYRLILEQSRGGPILLRLRDEADAERLREEEREFEEAPRRRYEEAVAEGRANGEGSAWEDDADDDEGEENGTGSDRGDFGEDDDSDDASDDLDESEDGEGFEDIERSMAVADLAVDAAYRWSPAKPQLNLGAGAGGAEHDVDEGTEDVAEDSEDAAGADRGPELPSDEEEGPA